MSMTLGPEELVADAAETAANHHAQGHAYGRMLKSAGRPVAAPVLSGRLVASGSGWLLLTVPNALVRGLFDAMDEEGIELPPGHEGRPFNAHISVMTGDEVARIGGPEKISERGHSFSYQLGPLKSVDPKGWGEMSRAWFVEVQSPELRNLRKSYGLTPLPNGDHAFHVTVAVRRKRVLHPDPEVTKAAGNRAEAEGGAGRRIASEGARSTRDQVRAIPSGVLQISGGQAFADPAGHILTTDNLRHYGLAGQVGRVLDRLLQDPDYGPGYWSDSAAWVNRHTGQVWVSLADAANNAREIKRELLKLVPEYKLFVGDEVGAPDDVKDGWIRVLQNEGKEGALDQPMSPEEEKVRDKEEKLVREIVKSIPESDLYGAWWNRSDGKVRVSLGDWSETSSREVEERLAGILDVAHVEVEAEIGAPDEPGWEKLADLITEAEVESALIRANQQKPENQRPHDFEPAEWTHPNGHPRCIRCGDEQPVGGRCEGHDPDRHKPVRDAAEATRLRRIAKHDRRVARAHNPKIRAFGRMHGLDISDILLPVEKQAAGPGDYLTDPRAIGGAIGAGIGGIGGYLAGKKHPWLSALGGAGAGGLAGMGVGSLALPAPGSSPTPPPSPAPQLPAGLATALMNSQEIRGRIGQWLDQPAIVHAPQSGVYNQERSVSLLDDDRGDDEAPMLHLYNHDVTKFHDLLRQLERMEKGGAVPPPLIDAILAQEQALDRKVKGPPRALPMPPPVIIANTPAPPPPLPLSLLDPSPAVFNDATMDALVHEQMVPDGDPFPVPEKEAALVPQVLPNNAAMVTALLPARRPVVAPAPAPVRRRRRVGPPAALLQAQDEALNVESLIPLLRARAAARARLVNPPQEVINGTNRGPGNPGIKTGNLGGGRDSGCFRPAHSEERAGQGDRGPHPLFDGSPDHGILPRELRQDGARDGPDLERDQEGRLGSEGVQGLLKAAADFAPGLPTRGNLGNLTRLQPGQVHDYVVQHHRAHRAGPHYDVRIGSQPTGMYSWAAPKGVPVPGEKNLAIRQPLHRHAYNTFQGEIPRGYGAGTVKTHDLGKVLITKVGPDHIHFTTAHVRHPERFVLMKPRSFGRAKDWLLANVTPTEKVPFEKLRYKRIPAEQIEGAIRTMGEGGSVEAKVDGASQLVHLVKGHAEHLSFRTSKETGRPIVHTERVFGGRPQFPYPKHLEGSVLKGELYSSPEVGKANGPQDVGTLLNSSIARSLQLQGAQGVKIRNMLYDVQRYGQRNVGPDVPRPERRRMLEEIAGHLPSETFHTSEPVTDPEQGVEMFHQIRSGTHPMTREGVVIHPAQGVPIKGKLTDEHDVYVTGTFPGEGKRQATFGGFTYGHEPGKTVGKVGSGFSDAFLAEVAKNPAPYIGRVARVQAQEKLPSGALRAPVFLGLHEDTNKVASHEPDRADGQDQGVRPGPQPGARSGGFHGGTVAGHQEVGRLSGTAAGAAVRADRAGTRLAGLLSGVSHAGSQRTLESGQHGSLPVSVRGRATGTGGTGRRPDGEVGPDSDCSDDHHDGVYSRPLGVAGPASGGAYAGPHPAGAKEAGLTPGMLTAVHKMPNTYGPDHKPSWTKHVMTHYDSTKPPRGIFTQGVADIVAAGHDPHVAPLGLGSWQKMVLFHRNRGGARLGEERRAVLQEAIRRLSDEIQRQRGVPGGTSGPDREVDLPGGEKSGALLPGVSLQPQQRRVRDRANSYDNRLLVYHGLGSGKSLASLASAEASGRPYAAVVPAALRPNYNKEIAKFTDVRTPHDVLSYTQAGMGQQPKVNPETLILDEAQRLRNPNSAATQAVKGMAAQAKRVLLLSGTPIVNQPSDLAVPMSLLTGQDMDPKEFDRRFVGQQEASPGLMGWLRGVKPVKVPAIQHEEELEGLLRGHVDYQPSKTPEGVRTNEERVLVDMSPQQKDFYRLMWNKLPWLTRWKMKNDYPMSPMELKNLQSFMTGPRQAALSLYPFQGKKDPMRAFQESAKLQAAFKNMQQTLTGNPRAKVLAYSNFIDAGLTPYEAALKAHGIPYSILHGKLNDAERKAQLDAYNSGKSRVLLLGPSAAEGISAQGTQLIQLLDPHWNEARMGQARGRGLRFDSHEGLPEALRDVRIQRYIARMPEPGFFGRIFGEGRRPSADEFLEAQSRRKEELNDQFRDVLRRVGTEPPTKPWYSLFG